jgi:hypothetical protein
MDLSYGKRASLRLRAGNQEARSKEESDPARAAKAHDRATKCPWAATPIDLTASRTLRANRRIYHHAGVARDCVIAPLGLCTLDRMDLPSLQCLHKWDQVKKGW